MSVIGYTNTLPIFATVGVSRAELTVAQAAKFLRMSEMHLNDLLDAEMITFQLENGERLISQDTLLEYEQEEERRHVAFDEFVRMNQEMGLYDD